MTAPDGSKRSWGRTLKNPIIHIEERFRLRIAMSTSETTLKGNLDFIDDKAGSLSEIWKVVQEPQKRKSTTFQDLHCTPWTENPGSNWDLMKQDLNMEGGNSILELNIAWLLKMKRLNQLPQGKVPVTCVMVKKFCEGILHLQDPTGEIAASTDKCVLDLRDYFRTGTALVLQKVGVYSGSNGDYYLNITRDNIVNIYSHKDDCAHRVQVNPTSVEELVTSQMQCEALQDTRLLLGRHKSTPPRRKSHSATYNDSPPCGSVINASSGPLAKATKSHFQWLDDDIFLAIDDNFLS
ncbi:uncharacterized protein LOC135367443 isoform X2 [Ornithodoros turicata]|uniref:uncharacterized protein LOC135367443 isoform X2 n=1 Tax=Ornithodoros turicata TaxID=34597 RepID=UPI003138D534